VDFWNIAASNIRSSLIEARKQPHKQQQTNNTTIKKTALKQINHF
jgi:hypothetical protein